jgi:hypothetical protein
MEGFSFDEESQRYLSFISFTRCSICNNKHPCLPMNLPWYRTEVLICNKCLYNVYNFLSVLGKFKAQMDHDIRAGTIREQITPTSDVSYVRVYPPIDLSDDPPPNGKLNQFYPFDKIEIDYDEHERERFIKDQSLFANPPELSAPYFVEEIIARKKISPEGYYQWEDIVAANDPLSKRKLVDKYFTEENPRRLYRFSIDFSLCFHNWIDPTQTFPKMLIRLKDQYDALSLVAEWHDQNKIEIFGKDSSPSFLNFIVTPDILYEALAHPGIGHNILDFEIATLAQNHYLDEIEVCRKKYLNK